MEVNLLAVVRDGVFTAGRVAAEGEEIPAIVIVGEELVEVVEDDGSLVAAADGVLGGFAELEILLSERSAMKASARFPSPSIASAPKFAASWPFRS